MRKRICERALNWIQITDCKGTVRICGWMYDEEIGSLSCQSFKEIYHSEHAKEIRQRLMNGDYSMCRIDACPYLATKDIENHMVEIDEIPEYPEQLNLAFENNCNYACTCCGVRDSLDESKTDNEETCYDVIEEQLKEVLPHIKTISANGLGELFCSKRTLRLLANWKPLMPADEVSVILESNGSLFDEKHWKQIENLGQYYLHVAITVMSFEESTYQILSGTKLPISRIEENLRFIKSLREKGIVNFFEIATVVQERNFRKLPEFARRCVEEFGADYVRLRPYEPWEKNEPEVRWFTNIRNPRHPYYEEYKEIMRNEIFKHPLVYDWSGGLDAASVDEFPYKKEYKVLCDKEYILTNIVLQKEKIIKNILKSNKEKTIIYGLGNVGKVLCNILIEEGITPAYILDKFKVNDEYKGIKIYDLKTAVVEPKTVIIITPLTRLDEIKKDLEALGCCNNTMIWINNLIECDMQY